MVNPDCIASSVYIIPVEGSAADDRILWTLQCEQEVSEVPSRGAPEGKQEGMVEVRHHCRAGGGRQEENQNVVLETHEAA